MGAMPRSVCRNFLNRLELESCEICIHIHANHMQITPPPDQLQEGKAAACPSSPGSAPPTQPRRHWARDPMSPDPARCLSEETEAEGDNGLMDLPISLLCPEPGRKLYGEQFQLYGPASRLLTEGERLYPGREPGTQAQYSSGQGEHLCRATPGLLKKQ